MSDGVMTEPHSSWDGIYKVMIVLSLPKIETKIKKKSRRVGYIFRSFPHLQDQNVYLSHAPRFKRGDGKLSTRACMDLGLGSGSSVKIKSECINKWMVYGTCTVEQTP